MQKVEISFGKCYNKGTRSDISRILFWNHNASFCDVNENKDGDPVNFVAKTFMELSVEELYEIVKSRAEIFFLEQKMVCQDLDDKDQTSLHCFFTHENRVVAYLRAFPSAEDTVLIGRVLTLEHRKGLGSMLMQESVEEIKKRFGSKKICVHAQKQAADFYKKMGFTAVSDEYSEEGIPHLTMERYL